MTTIFFGNLTSNLLKGKASESEQRAAAELLLMVYRIDTDRYNTLGASVERIHRYMFDGSGEKLGKLGAAK